jgi:hypothetical protein
MKRNLIFTVILSSAILISCTPNIDQIFEQSASERTSGALDNTQKLLASQTNGWLVEYYPESTQKYGGFNLFFKFVGENAVVKSELDPSKADTSIYEMKADMGPAINFTTYNTVLHYFSDPILTVGGGRGLAYEGDYEFVIVNTSETEIILRGKKTKNTIRMTPFPANVTWEEYCNTVSDAKLKHRPLYLHINGTDTLRVANDGKSFVMSYKNDTVEVSERIAYICTPQGMKLYKPFEYAGKSFLEFTFREDNSLLSSGEIFVPKLPDNWLPIDVFEGVYTLTHRTSTAGTGTLYTKTVTLTREGDKYLLSGLMPNLGLKVVLDYDFMGGALLISQQRLTTIGANNLNFTALMNTGSLYPTLFYVGQQARWNGSSSPIQLEWVDYGKYASPIIGFLLWQTNAATGANAGQYTTGAADQRFWTYIKMTKQ